jgi:hypothetical protein
MTKENLNQQLANKYKWLSEYYQKLSKAIEAGDFWLLEKLENSIDSVHKSISELEGKLKKKE